MKTKSTWYPKLLEYLHSIPVIDCHDHTGEAGPRYKDPIDALMDFYYVTDLGSVADHADEIEFILNSAIPWRERWSTFKKLYDLSCHTGYALVIKKVLARFYDEPELTFEAMERMETRLLDLTDEKVFDDILNEAGIATRIEDIFGENLVHDVLAGRVKLSPRARMTISMLNYHSFSTYEEIQYKMKPLHRQVTTLDEYLAGCFEIFTAYKKMGAVAMKDQSAYNRKLDVGNPTKAEAEAVFNWIVSDPRRKVGYPDQAKPLDDYLFHAFIRMARDLDLPVQFHTGLLAGTRNNISNANASHLIPLLELHRDVRFDLFHANWPYGGEWLFLGKNYPNVYLNFCWANIIDQFYCQQLFQQCVSVVPHGKVFAYGSDFGGQADHAWAHAEIMRENLAIALSNLIDNDSLTMAEAKTIAIAWMYENPNRFFKLGLPSFHS